jgi:hypothetical protein
MACATVWSLRESTDAESEELKEVLGRLSGKRLKRGRPPSSEILLSGLFVWLQMFDFLVSIDFDLTKVISTNSTLKKIIENRKKNVYCLVKFRNWDFIFLFFLYPSPLP